jgi:transposase
VATAAASFPAEDRRPLKVFFQDEGRFGRISDPTGCWAPGGVRPLVPAHLVREYTHVFSAVCPRDGQSFSLVLPYADTEAMQIFLKELADCYKDYRVVVILDRAAWHRSPQFMKFENLRILYQPPYSPEVNPVEHLWEHIREKYLRNWVWDSLEALETELVRILQELVQSTETLQSLTGFHWAII